jgi:hypothetical protein
MTATGQVDTTNNKIWKYNTQCYRKLRDHIMKNSPKLEHIIEYTREHQFIKTCDKIDFNSPK